jgi:hypothetical protein
MLVGDCVLPARQHGRRLYFFCRQRITTGFSLNRAAKFSELAKTLADL